jgi:hypothetical protein
VTDSHYRNLDRTVTVRWEQVGFHCWPEAAGVRQYLSTRHRHKFFFTLTVDVFHNDREIEFHDLLDFAKGIIIEQELGRQSCEDLATTIIDAVVAKYPQTATTRTIRVSVFEDNEVGATLTRKGTQ